MEYLINALVIVLSFLQPSYINFYIQNLSCDKIEGRSYLTFNLEQECWVGTHLILSSTLTVPLLLFWMIIFPGIFLVYMIRKKNQLNDEFVYQVTKFFQTGFKHKFFYWEFINMLRKFIIILLTTFLRDNQQVVIYILIPVMAFFFFLQVYTLPFEFSRHNRLEMISLNSAFITYYSGVFYLRSISEVTKLLFLLLILISNIVYLLFWIKSYIDVMRQNFSRVVTTLRTRITKRSIVPIKSNTSLKKQSSLTKVENY